MYLTVPLHAARTSIEAADEQMQHSSPESVIVFIPPRPSKQTIDHSRQSFHVHSKMPGIMRKQAWNMQSPVGFNTTWSFTPPLPFPSPLPLWNSSQPTQLFEQFILLPQLPDEHTEEYLITPQFSPSFSPRTTSKWPLSSPRFQAPALARSALLRGSPPPPHTQLCSTAGLVPGQMKTHTITHSSPGSERGEKRPCFDWTADSELCLKFFHLLEIFKWESVMLSWEIGFLCCHILFERLSSLCWDSLDEDFIFAFGKAPTLTSSQDLNMLCPVTLGQAPNVTANLEITLVIVVRLVKLK